MKLDSSQTNVNRFGGQLRHNFDMPVAVITGGRSGIGLAVAQKLSADDWEIVIFSRSDDADGSVKRQLSEKCSMLQVDVNDHDKLFDSFAAVFEKHKQIDFGT